MLKVEKKKGRPSKKQIVGNLEITRFKPQLVKMDDVKFDDNLFVPMKTGKKIDSLLSSEGGIMAGINMAVVGDPGVGKSTVLLDLLSDLQAQGKKCLFISGEMTSIDLYGYVKRYPKFGSLDILFMGDYLDKDPIAILKSVLHEVFDFVLIDSMAEVCNSIVDFHGGTNKSAESKILNILEGHNKAENKNKKHTSFIIIQQMTKQGSFQGSNRFKHMMTSMYWIKFEENRRCIFFDKNRRGGRADKLFFSLDTKNHVNWTSFESHNMNL
jgi:DNA repair protein RadA/Sms